MSEQAEILDAQPAELTLAVQKVSTELAGFNRIAAGLAELKAAHPPDVVLDVKTTAGMKQAITSRAAWREPRIAIEKVRKAAKAPVLDLGRKIDDFAESLTEQLRIGEENYDGQIQAEATRKAEEKRRAEEAEQKRKEAIELVIKTKFTDVPRECFGCSALVITDRIKQLDEETTEYAEFTMPATLARDKALRELQAMLNTQRAREAEAERIKAAQEEHARQAAALAQERAAFEAQQREQRQREEAVRAELRRLDDAKREEADRIAAAERKRLDAIAARQRELAQEVGAILDMPRNYGGTVALVDEGVRLLSTVPHDGAYWGEQYAAAMTAVEEAGELLAKRHGELLAEAKRKEDEAKAEAKRLKDSRKLAAAQKAGPRLLAALKVLDPWLEESEAQRLDPAYGSAVVEARAAIEEAEPSGTAA